MSALQSWLKKDGAGTKLVLFGAILLAAVAAYAIFTAAPAGSDVGVSAEAETVDAVDATIATASTPSFDLVRISRGGTGVIAGRMAPGAQVDLYANGDEISSVTADENGEWVIILDEPLATGSIELTLRAVLGSDESESDDVVVVSVPEIDDPGLIAPEERGVVAVLSPKDGEGGSRILQKPGRGGFSDLGSSLVLETLDYGGSGDAVVAGRAIPRARIRIYLDEAFVGQVRADDDGNWRLGLPESIPSGGHRLRVDQTLADGEVEVRIEQPFESGEPFDASLAESGVLVRPGNTLWQIARQIYGRGTRYTLIFRENTEQIKDPNLIYPGQIFKLPYPSAEVGR